MKISNTNIDGVLLIEPDIYRDNRGFFLETFNQKKYADIPFKFNFSQENLSFSKKGVIRGLHYQNKIPQGKLIRVVKGEVYDVIVDIRPNSKTFGKWESFIINDVMMNQLWIPPGFAHGFQSLSEDTLFEYNCTDYYQPNDEKTIKWNDNDLNILWPIINPIVSLKDAEGINFSELL